MPDVAPGPRSVDVGFVGTISPTLSRTRCKELERLLLLRREGINVVTREGVFLVDMLNFYADSKIVFQHSGQGPNNLTFRISEAMAAGALVLAGRPEEVGDLVGQQLVEGEHIVYYDSWEEAVELIHHYRSNEEDRARISEAGRRLILDEFPWHRQIEYFVDTGDDVFAVDLDDGPSRRPKGDMQDRSVFSAIDLFVDREPVNRTHVL